MAGGTAVSVPLSRDGSAWGLDMTALEAAFSNKTKAIVLNTPHNPTGKVFTKEEMRAIGSLCEKYDSLIISDEVYEMITYAGRDHIPTATVDDLWHRTVSFGSAGKVSHPTTLVHSFSQCYS